MSLGFEQAGFAVSAAVDDDPINVDTHGSNFPDCATLRADLSLLTGHDLRTRCGLAEEPIHVLFGGPPCQGFSIIGKRRADDPRNQGLLHFARLVAELCPYYFVVENVGGLAYGTATEVLESFVGRVEDAGYLIVTPIQVLDASCYGVPQRRKRVFILGYKRGLPIPHYPLPPNTQDKKQLAQPPTVWDAIGDLAVIDTIEPPLIGDVYVGDLGVPSAYVAQLWMDAPASIGPRRSRPGSLMRLTGCLRTKHTPSTVERFAATQPGSYEPVSRFFRLTSDGVSPTLRAGTGPSHGSFTAPRPIHPLRPRCIAVREAARLHSFPDWFSFHPTNWHGFRQVGNSVPPLLARAVAEAVRHTLDLLSSEQSRLGD
jgi:DNA (cytosine-5)-methyltransferase 1